MVVSLLPTPTARDSKGRSLDTRAGGPGLPDALLPSPRATDGTKGGPNQRGSAGDPMLPSVVVDLLPTPSAMAPDARVSEKAKRLYSSSDRLGDVVEKSTWGKYAPAIARWEQVLGRPAPAPTEPTGRAGAHRLSPRFVEWMMGLPDGWVTGVPGVSRNEQLRALGNGVLPLQAAAALRHLLAMRELAVTEEVAA
jgi:DNA (cytosine-5)-methyltransferase 1